VLAIETTTEWSWPEWMSFKLQTTMNDAFVVKVRVREVCGTWLHHARFGLNQARQAPVRLRIARGDLSQGGVHRKLVLAIETTTELSWPEWMFFKLQTTMKDAFVEVRVPGVCGTWLHHDRFGLNEARQALGIHQQCIDDRLPVAWCTPCVVMCIT